ncbi:MAG: S8 family serine peptidase, partial [Rhodothermales bacterium]|nr:S8 family serine peptidase [Rhodothermales bacterium]
EMIPSASHSAADIAANYAVVESGTSMAAAHVSGAAALLLSKETNMSPAQVKNALIAMADARVFGAPAGTTDKGLWIGGEATASLNVPPFFQFAVASGNTLNLNGGVHVGVESGLSSTMNGNIYSTGDLSFEGSGNLVEGFGYYRGDLAGSSSSFQPRYNPADQAVHQRVDEIAMPYLNADSFSNLATTNYGNSLFLSGDYALGTCLEPAIWHVNGTVETTGPVTFTGYGIIIATGDIKVGHDMFTAITGDESQLGLYTEGKLETTASHADIAAQVYTNGTPVLEDGTRILGSIVTQGGVDFKGSAEVLYRPASPALTEPIWPIGNWDGACPQIDTSGALPDLAISNPTVDEEAGTARVDLQLSFATSQTISLNYQTVDGTAEAGRDYTAKSGTVTIPAGSTTWTLFVPISAETVYEAGPENFTMQFSGEQNVNLLSSAAVVTIEDNDPVPSITAKNGSIGEGSGSGNATISLSNPSQFPISFDYGTSSGTASSHDYTDVAGSLTIQPYSSSAQVSIPVAEDPMPEPSETLTMAVTNPQGATIADASGTISITDNEPSIRIHNKSVDERDGTMSIRVSLSHASPYEITATYASSDGTAGTDRYDAISGALTFPAGTTERFLTTNVYDNAVPDSDRHFTVALGNVTHAHVGDANATATIKDDEPHVSIADAAASEAAGSMSFTVSLSRTPVYAVSVDYASLDATAFAGDDYQAAFGSVNFAPGQTSKQVTVSVVNDSEYERDEMFTVMLSGAQGAHMGDNGATGTIRNDDAAPMPVGTSSTSSTSSTTDGGGTSGTTDSGNTSGTTDGGSATGTTDSGSFGSSYQMLDTFSSISFSGSNGATSWSGSWMELGESNGPTKGKTRVVSHAMCDSGNCARFNPKRGQNDGLSRAADLSGATSATLSVYVRGHNYNGANARLEVSSGSGWTTLHSFADGSTGGQTLTFDISSFISSNTQIRVKQYSAGTGGYLYLDNVEITTN